MNRQWSEEEKACETHFVENTIHNQQGQFIVALPLKEQPEKLGDSLQQAQTRFFALERKFNSNPKLKDMYKEFMKEYEDLKHMTKVDKITNDKVTYFIPHHCVLREESLTTKLRVVFDASARTSTGYSLNDLQMVGPTIQDDLMSILLRFRKHTYVISADVTKMYRQILIRPEDRPLQRILWRSNQTENLCAYDLNTVTYGTTAAPFLAIRSLYQLGEDCEQTNPDIGRIIKKDFYVDDLLTGANSLDEAAYICGKMSKILQDGGFELRKFVSNKQDVLREVSQKTIHLNIINLGENENTKVLGLHWCPQTDQLTYKIGNISDNRKVTKRNMLSNIGQIFDPLGLLSPCIVLAKIMLQKLWLEKLNWDDDIPIHILTEWENFTKNLITLNQLTIPRQVTCEKYKCIEMHGFSDASENAYGACIYIRTIDVNDKTKTRLLCSKTKVAPLKMISIPRLELCGALTLAKLANKVQTAFNINFNRIIFWTDSNIVLGWLKMPPRQLQTFVGNRVSEIHQLISNCQWRHVPTKDNPADLLSRGICATKIINLGLWWNGPEWLMYSDTHWPECGERMSTNHLPDIKKVAKFCLVTNETNEDMFPFHKFSKLTRLKRITSYVKRFLFNCQTSKEDRKIGCLDMQELNDAHILLIRIAQQQTYASIKKQIYSGQPIQSKSNLSNLNPFLDEDGILRVGGRLTNSDYEFNKKHPIILDGKHYLSKLIVDEYHRKFHHAGSQLLLAVIREEFWLVAGRNLIKKVLKNCIVCFRNKPLKKLAIMGNLPQERITPSPPFYNTGVDYAGPIIIKDRKGRGCKLLKCYISIFICFSTKALHLELVSDLTKDAFILAVRRFVSRRGKPSKIFSDNGSNFVGANSELQQLSKFIDEHEDDIIKACTQEDICWKFIPPHSPHFGGLWEAGVKSIKYHLRRVAGNAHLTYEELYTLIVQIEAILNSRPLSPLSSHPQDFNPLTPAHFLIGRPLLAIPDANYTNIPENRLNVYQHIQMLMKHFWERWRKEYIGELQQRLKWKTSQKELKVGTLVLLHDDQLPPFKWKLGRVTMLHPGKDGVARVASIRTPTSVTKRVLAKLCPLPVD